MAINREQIKVGMAVTGSRGTHIGHVRAVRDADFQMGRVGLRDVYAPFEAVERVSDDQVVLRIPAAQVDQMGWATPPATTPGPGGINPVRAGAPPFKGE